MIRRLAFLLLVPALACSGVPQQHSSTQSPTATPRASSTPAPTVAPQTIYQVGDKVEVYSDDRSTDVVLTVNSVADNVQSGNPYITPPPSGRWLTLNVTLQNKSSQVFNASSGLNFEVRDETGQSYQATTLPGRPQGPDGEIAPGDQLRGEIAIGVPSGHSFKLYFKAALISHGQTVVDLGQH